MGSFQTSPSFDMRSRAGAQTKAVDPVSRFRWALSFQGISHAAGKVLAALADHADQRKLTCFPSVETLARETQVHRRTVQTALRQLEAAGAILTDRSRGRSSSLYRLMIHPNPADSAPFNRGVSPPSPTRQSFPPTRQSFPPTRQILPRSTVVKRHPSTVAFHHP